MSSKRFIKVQGGYIDIDTIVFAKSGANKEVSIITDITGERHTFDGNLDSLIALLEEDVIDENLKKIADHYGLDSQLSILQEECAELVQAVSKYKRGDCLPFIENNEAIIEEMADVMIMMFQIQYLMKIPGSFIENQIEKKVDRQLKRIEEENNE